MTMGVWVTDWVRGGPLRGGPAKQVQKLYFHVVLSQQPSRRVRAAGAGRGQGCCGDSAWSSGMAEAPPVAGACRGWWRGPAEGWPRGLEAAAAGRRLVAGQDHPLPQGP